MPDRRDVPTLDPTRPESMAAWGMFMVESLFHISGIVETTNQEVGRLTSWQSRVQAGYDRRQAIREDKQKQQADNDKQVDRFKRRLELVITFIGGIATAAGIITLIF